MRKKREVYKVYFLKKVYVFTIDPEYYYALYFKLKVEIKCR
jgi:hypothetical protein